MSTTGDARDVHRGAGRTRLKTSFLRKKEALCSHVAEAPSPVLCLCREAWQRSADTRPGRRYTGGTEASPTPVRPRGRGAFGPARAPLSERGGSTRFPRRRSSFSAPWNGESSDRCGKHRPRTWGTTGSYRRDGDKILRVIGRWNFDPQFKKRG